MKRVLPVLVLLAVSSTSAQQDVIRSTVTGVRLIVQVRSGIQPVRDLTGRDFVVRDAGVDQRIDGATLAANLSVALLVDTSLSMRRGTFEDVMGVMRKAEAELRPGDRAAVVAVSDHPTLLQPSTAESSRWQGTLDALGLQPAGFTPQTALWDGLLFAAAQAASADGSPLVLLISDGRDNASWLSRTTAGRTLARVAVAVDVIGFDTPAGGPDWQPPGLAEFPSDITHDSGGQYFDATDKNLGTKLKTRFDELRSSYVLTYTPRGVKTDDGWHAVTVRVPNRHVTVKAQAGYYAGK